MGSALILLAVALSQAPLLACVHEDEQGHLTSAWTDSCACSHGHGDHHPEAERPGEAPEDGSRANLPHCWLTGSTTALLASGRAGVPDDASRHGGPALSAASGTIARGMLWKDNEPPLQGARRPLDGGDGPFDGPTAPGQDVLLN